MTYVDDELARFIDAFDPQPEADPWAGWRAVAVIAAVCAVALAVVGLALSGPGDMRVAGASPASAAAYHDYCHSSPERKAWCDWQGWMAEPRNQGWFAVSSHFGDNDRLLAQARRVVDCESRFEPRALNRSSGAAGLFQVMPQWASRYEQVTGVPYYDGRFDPQANARFARWLWQQSGTWSHWSCPA